MCWIALDDAVRALCFCLEMDTLTGPVNLVSPNPVTNEEFSRTLGRVLKRPAVIRIPAGLIRLVLGRMGEETVLLDVRALPRKLEESGFAFHFAQLEPALRNALNAPLTRREATR